MDRFYWVFAKIGWRAEWHLVYDKNPGLLFIEDEFEEERYNMERYRKAFPNVKVIGPITMPSKPPEEPAGSAAHLGASYLVAKTVSDWKSVVQELALCHGETDWLLQHESLEAGWNACERGDWLLSLAEGLGVAKQLVVRAGALCVREALVHLLKENQEPAKAVEDALAWCEGKSEACTYARIAGGAFTSDYATEANAAAYSAAAAAYGIADATTPDAVHSAADAVYAAATAAAYAASWSTRAFKYATFAASSAAADTARRASLKKSANIVRSTIPFETVWSRLC